MNRTAEPAHRRRRRQRFWRYLRDRWTLRAILWLGLVVYRIIRWVIDHFGSG